MRKFCSHWSCAVAIPALMLVAMFVGGLAGYELSPSFPPPPPPPARRVMNCAFGITNTDHTARCFLVFCAIVVCTAGGAAAGASLTAVAAGGLLVYHSCVASGEPDYRE